MTSNKNTNIALLTALGVPTKNCLEANLKFISGTSPVIEAKYHAIEMDVVEISKLFKVEEITDDKPVPFILYFGKLSAINHYIKENNLHNTPHIHIRNTQSVRSYAGPLINIIFLDGWAETTDLGDILNLIVHRQQRYINSSITIDFR